MSVALDDWYPSGDPAGHLIGMLNAVDWPGINRGEPLHPRLAGTIRESALWIIEGREPVTLDGQSVHPLQYGCGGTIADHALVDAARAVLLWLTDTTDPTLFAAMDAASQDCVRFGDLLAGED